MSGPRKPHAIPLRALGRPLGAATKRHLARDLARLLAWQTGLGRWPRVARAPSGVPFVSLYAGGRLVGCYGSDEGGPGERVARAFLRALHDGRAAGVRAAERASLAADVAYVQSAWEIARDGAADLLEAGTHGVGVLGANGAPVILLPDVACERACDARGLLELLRKKSGASELPPSVFAFVTDGTSARAGRRAEGARAATPSAEAAAWLASLVDDDGAVTFAVDARARKKLATGPMHHGRVAVAVRALAAHGNHPAAVARARRRLARDLTRVPTPDTRADAHDARPAVIAGTLALALLAGVAVRDALVAACRAPELRTNAWHGAQVVTALGADAPEDLWRACVRDLDARPWAPWTAIAARARGDGETLARTARVLVPSIRADAPYAGGAGVSAVPETALTAIVVEALAPLGGASAERAVRAARGFLHAQQIRRARVPARLDPALAGGAFRASPVAEGLRIDVTGHALLALHGAG